MLKWFVHSGTLFSTCILSRLANTHLQRTSTQANRASLIEESTKAKTTSRDLARLEKQRKLAEMLRSKADAEERGEDVDREKNWEWTIEENDGWEKKLARKARRADFEFHGGFMFPSFLPSLSAELILGG